MVTISSIPHFFVEILAFALLLAVSSKLTKLLLEKSPTYLEKQKENLSLKLSIINLLKIYVFIALPLFVIAAFSRIIYLNLYLIY